MRVELHWAFPNGSFGLGVNYISSLHVMDTDVRPLSGKQATPLMNSVYKCQDAYTRTVRER